MTRCLALRLVGALVLGVISAGCEAGARPGSIPSWTPDDGPTPTIAHPVTLAPPSGGSTPTIADPVRFPAGLNGATSGVFYAETDGGVFRVDIARRSLQFVATPRLEFFRSFVATRNFLVVKQIDDGAGYVVMRDGNIRDLPSEFGGTGRLHAAGRDAVWVVTPEEPSRGYRVISKFSASALQPRQLGRRVLPDAYGIPWSDEAGNLLVERLPVTYVVTQSSTRRLRGWRQGSELVGINKTSILVMPCPKCDVALRGRSRSAEKPRATRGGLRAIDRLLSTYDHAGDGLLSPSGRYVAMTITLNDDQHHDRLAVTDMVTGRTTLIPGSMTDINPNNQFAWLSQSNDRYLLAVSDRTLHIFDTRSATVFAWVGVTVDRICVVGR